jgi:YVTN family beta-propeller protein
MDFRILGPLEVDRAGRQLALEGRQQRALLALLLLHANEVVPVHAIIDELWPETPPPSATRSVHALVSRLRRLLEGEPLARNGGEGDNGVLLTRSHGYLLRVAPGELDLHRFESLLRKGRDALAAGQADVAARMLREALALWRGPPLAEFAHGSFAVVDIARLNELRLSALEERIEADLAAGRSAELVAELEALVATHPLRERLRGQLMRALYRCGRQADALQVYQDTRRQLVGELGIEPSPALQSLEQAILRQEGSLEPPMRVGSDHQRSVRRRIAVAGITALLAAAAVLAALLATRGEPSPAVHVLGNSLAVIDPASNRVERQIPVGPRPASIVYGKHALWVANLDENSISRVDPRTNRVVRTIPTDASPAGIAFAAGSLYVANSDAATVSRIEPQYGRAMRTIAVRNPSGFPVGALAVGAHAVWVVNSAGTVSRLDPARGAVAAPIIVGEQPSAIASGAGAVWVANHRDGTVTRIDPIDASQAVTTTITVGDGPAAIAVGARAVWVADELADTVVRIDPDTNDVTATIAVGRRPSGIAVGSGAVWVANAGDGTVSRIDPRRNAVVKTIRLGSSPAGVVAAAGSIWVTVQESAPRAPAPAPEASGGSARFNIESGFDFTDPALAYFGTSWQLEYATCAKLLNYPDRSGPAGSRLVPEVAKSLPAASAGGRRYTFRIRDGFRFSPPSNEPVTAATFKYAIERSLSPKLGRSAIAPVFLGDVVGVDEYRAGLATHIAGVAASGNTLTIELTHVARDFPARIALPFFCAVPIGTSPDPRGLREIPSAGPYYVSSYTPKEQIVLRRNPNYRGARPHRLDEIVYTLGVAKMRTVAQIGAGRADYAPDGIPPGSAARLAAQYGPDSPAAQAGKQRFFAEPLLGVSYLALNTSRPLFADVNLRKAVNYAIDRRALLRQQVGYAGAREPTDQYLAPGMPGFEDAHIYPLARPDLATAKRLARGRGGRAVFYTCNTTACSHTAEIVKSNLKPIGIEVEVKQFPISLLLAKAGTQGEPFDIVDSVWAADYVDPFSFLNSLLDGTGIKARGNTNYAYFDDPAYNKKLRAAARLTAPERYRVYGALDADLARNAAPLVALGNLTTLDLFSRRIGCQLYQPVYGLDLASLCLRRSGG